MSFTVKLAIFPPWKAPTPYGTLGETFATFEEASLAGQAPLRPVVENELAAIAPGLHPASATTGNATVTVISVPAADIHGFVIFDETGAEVGSWTMLDEAVKGAAGGRLGRAG